jgi:glycosyltransferase involved in cell wall biosynthesis
MKFSIIIPARNEEKLIGKCLDSIKVASEPYSSQVEIIVCINRCTDKTEEIARSYGAKIVYDDSKNLAKIRNTAAKSATGEILVTIDADSRMSSNMLTEIEQKLRSGKYIGGGVPIRLDRLSLGLILSAVFLLIPLTLCYRISAGLFWCERKDFEAVGGFNEQWLSAEDIEFARRLKKYGITKNKKYKTLWKTYIYTSMRKFDKFGDWIMLRHPIIMLEILRGKHHELADEYFYDFKR